MLEPNDKAIHGRLNSSSVIIDEQIDAQSVYNKGYFGVFSNGVLSCDLMEALYLMESKNVEIYDKKKKISFSNMYILLSKKISFSSLKYFVYRDVRMRGFVIKFRNDFIDFNVLPRGGNPKRNPSRYWIKVYSERWHFDVKGIIELAEIVSNSKKIFIIAVVDEEGDITYYKIRFVKPKGKILPLAPVTTLIESFLFEDRVIVYDPASISFLQNNGLYGKVMNEYLVLSLLESIYLIDKGYISIKNSKTGRMVTLTGLKKLYKRIEKNLTERIIAYKELRENGVLVKTGFKYGSHFRCYSSDPNTSHAKYLIHVVPDNYVTIWPEISRAVRLAHGVKKELILAVVGKDEKITYIHIERTRL